MVNVREILQKGLAHHQAGQLKDAETCYRKVLKQDRRNVDATHLLGVVLLDGGKPNDAICLIKKASVLSPKRGNIYVNLGNAYVAADRLADAAKAYQRATECDPNDLDAIQRLADTCRKLEKFEDAVAAHQKAVSLAPNNGRLYLALGVALKDAGKYDEAEQIYRGVLSKAPHYAEAKANLAVVLQKQKRADEAIESYRDAVTQRPDFLRQATLNLASTGKGKLWLNLRKAEQELSKRVKS